MVLRAAREEQPERNRCGQTGVQRAGAAYILASPARRIASVPGAAPRLACASCSTPAMLFACGTSAKRAPAKRAPGVSITRGSTLAWLACFACLPQRRRVQVGTRRCGECISALTAPQRQHAAAWSAVEERALICLKSEDEVPSLRSGWP